MEPTILTPEIFATIPQLVAGCTTRHGGISPAPYDGLNMGMNTGDKEDHILANRASVAAWAGLQPDQLAVMHQIHSGTIKTIQHPGFYPDIDGMVTDHSQVALCVGIADCAAILFADPQNRVIGACHSGWRGTVANIARNTLAQMQDLGAVPAQTLAYISPCIGLANFEVGEEVAAQFPSPFVHRRKDWPKPHLDLKGVIQAQLMAEGLLADHIEVASHCTVAQNDTFFSYRAEQGRTGRMFGFIALRP